MQLRQMKAICLPVLVVVVLLLGVTPVSAQTEEMEHDCSSYIGQGRASVPSCCVTADCPLSGPVTASVAPSPGRLVQGKAVQPVRPRASVDPAPCLNGEWAGKGGQPPDLPGPSSDEFRCRDCLKSEEPPLI